MKLKNNLKLIRSKYVSKIKTGETVTVQRIEDPDFLLRVSLELPELYQEAVSSKSPEKFADIVELIECVASKIEIDWSEVNKIKFNKRWESGKYGDFIGAKNSPESLDE